jgi:hypothetical protein
MKKLFLLFALFVSIKGLTCDCQYGGSFIKMARKSQVAVLVRVTKFLTFKVINAEKTAISMEVEIIDVYKGKDTPRRVIVRGDSGDQCRPYLSVFKEGGHYLMALLQESEPTDEHKGEKQNAYFLSNCGAFWLSVNMTTASATGDINSDSRKAITMKLSAIKEWLTKKEPLDHACKKAKYPNASRSSSVQKDGLN